MRLVIVTAATVAGAALFAALHPAPRDAYEAAATLVVPVLATPASELAPRTRQAAAVLRAPATVGEARERALQGSEPGRALRTLRVDARPDAGVVSYSVRGASPQTALDLANHLAAVTLETLQRGLPSSPEPDARIVGSFEYGEEDWAATGGPGGAARVEWVSGGRYGGGALRVHCVRQDGCGAARALQAAAPAGEELVLTAWVRGSSPATVRLVLGEEGTRPATAAPVRLAGEWQRLEVRWTPEQPTSDLVVGVENAGPGPADLRVDGVLLLSERPPLDEARERRLLAESTYAYLTPPRIVASRTGRTLTWAAIGAAAGAFVGAIGAVAATLARRRSLSP